MRRRPIVRTAAASTSSSPIPKTGPTRNSCTSPIRSPRSGGLAVSDFCGARHESIPVPHGKTASPWHGCCSRFRACEHRRPAQQAPPFSFCSWEPRESRRAVRSQRSRQTAARLEPEAPLDTPPPGRPAPKRGPMALPATRKMAEPAPLAARRKSTRRSIAHRIVPRARSLPPALVRRRKFASTARRTLTRPASRASSATPRAPARSRAGTSRSQTRLAARLPPHAHRPTRQPCTPASRHYPVRCKSQRVTTPKVAVRACPALPQVPRTALGPVARGIRVVRAVPPFRRSPERRAPLRTSSVPMAACVASRSGMISNARTASGSK